MSNVRLVWIVMVRLERTHQLINLRGSLLDSPRLADLACGAKRASLLEQVFAHIRRSHEHV